MRSNLPFPAAGLILATVAGCGPGAPDSSSPPPQQFPTEFPAPAGRALELEDYYRVQSLRDLQLSPDGAWVIFTLALPVEETNGDAEELWIVPSDASRAPARILHLGREVTGPAWTEDGRLRYTAGGHWSIDPADPAAPPRAETSPTLDENVSPDGFWVVSLEDVPPNEESSPALSAFEARHEERFRGVQFDWLNFQRDGAVFPVPDPTASPSREIVITPVEGAAGGGGSCHNRRPEP